MYQNGVDAVAPARRAFGDQAQPADLGGGARDRYPAERLGQQSGHRLDLVGGQLGLEQLAEVFDRQPGGDTYPAVGQPFHRRTLGHVVLVGDLPDDLLQDVLDRDQPGCTAVLVHHDRDVRARRLHLPQQVVDRLGLRHERRLAHDLGDRRLRRTGFAAGGPADQVLQVHDPEDVVDVLADDRDPGEPAAHGQLERLAQVLGRLDPHHLGTGDHDLAHDRVPQGEHRVDHLPFAVLHDAPLLGEVDEFAEFDGGGERALPVPLAGRHGVADPDQQRGERAERGAEPAHQRRRGEPDGVRVLAPDRARPDADEDEADHGHRARRDERGPPARPEVVHGHQRHQRGGGQFAHQAQQQEQVDVAGGVGGDRLEGAGPALALAGQLPGAGRRHRAHGRIGHGEQTGEDHQPGRAREQGQVGHQPLRQLSSSRACRPNISRSSSGSAWS